LAINTRIPIDFSVVTALVLLPDVPVLLPDVLVLLPFVLVTLDDVAELVVQGDVVLQHSNPPGNEVQYPSPQF